MKKIKSMNSAVVTALLFCCGAVQAQTLSEDKMEFGVENITEAQVNHKGECNLVDLLRLDCRVPVSSAIAVEMGTLTTGMVNEERICDDVQTFSNVEAGNILLAVSKLGVEWEIDQRNTLFAGIRNMNEDYFISPVTSLFTNSSCGIFPTISCNHAIANYPLASMGAHYKGVLIEDKLILQASLYNGVGYKNFTGRDNVFRFCPNGDGVFALGQLEYQHKGSCYFLGASGQYGGRHYDDGSKCGTDIWTYAEQRINDRLSLMAAYSHSFVADAECSDFVGLGGMYTLKNCELGLFTDYARLGEDYECATELTCKYQFNSHVYLQPTLHAIVIPSSLQQDSHAFHTLLTLRVGVSF